MHDKGPVKLSLIPSILCGSVYAGVMIHATALTSSIEFDYLNGVAAFKDVTVRSIPAASDGSMYLAGSMQRELDACQYAEP